MQSVTGRQGVEYRHIILLAYISEVSEEVATQIGKNCRRQLPPRGTSATRICACTLYLQKLESLAYISVTVICAVDSKIRIFSAPQCILAVQGHPRSIIFVPIESAYATSC